MILPIVEGDKVETVELLLEISCVGAIGVKLRYVG